MTIEGKIECVLDQEISVKKGGLQSSFPSACLVIDSGQSIPIPTEVAQQLRGWKEGSRVRISGIGEALMEVEWLS
jgi:hypothetical protein